MIKITPNPHDAERAAYWERVERIAGAVAAHTRAANIAEEFDIDNVHDAVEAIELALTVVAQIDNYRRAEQEEETP